MKKRGSQSRICISTDRRENPEARPLARRMLSRLHALIKQADAKIVELWKWRKPESAGATMWFHDGLICIGETYKNAVKLTSSRGTSLDDPQGLFNHRQARPVPCLAHSFNGTCYCLGVRDTFRSDDAYAKRYPEEIPATRRGNMSADQHSILA